MPFPPENVPHSAGSDAGRETPEDRVARVPHVNPACDAEGCYCPDDVFWARMLGDDDPCAPGKDWAAHAFGSLDDDEGREIVFLPGGQA